MAGETTSQDIFIDADAGFMQEKDSYERIILLQIQKCIDVLNREMTGGQVVFKAETGGTNKYIEDVRELVINSIDTLRMVMISYIKDDYKKAIDKIKKDVDEYKEEMLDNEVIVPGKGKIKLKLLKNVPVDLPIYRDYIHYKALRYREMFEILVACYNSEKAFIRSLETE